MRKVINFITGILIIAPTMVNAQVVLNGAFDLWNDPGLENVEPSPENWSTNEAIGPSLGFVTKCVGYDSFGVQVKAVNKQGTVYSGILSYGKAYRTGYSLNSVNAGHPFTNRPVSFTGVYSFFPDLSDGDAAEVSVVLKKYNPQNHLADTIASGIMAFSASKEMKGFSLPLSYRSSDTPDTLTIVFIQSRKSNIDSDTNSYFRVDQLGFDEHLAIRNVQGELSLRIYPNPSNTFLQTDWIGQESGNYTIIDIVGRIVANGTVRNGGKIDVSALIDGGYIINITDELGDSKIRAPFIKNSLEN